MHQMLLERDKRFPRPYQGHVFFSALFQINITRTCLFMPCICARFSRALKAIGVTSEVVAKGLSSRIDSSFFSMARLSNLREYSANKNDQPRRGMVSSPALAPCCARRPRASWLKLGNVARSTTPYRSSLICCIILPLEGAKPNVVKCDVSYRGASARQSRRLIFGIIIGIASNRHRVLFTAAE